MFLWNSGKLLPDNMASHFRGACINSDHWKILRSHKVWLLRNFQSDSALHTCDFQNCYIKYFENTSCSCYITQSLSSFDIKKIIYKFHKQKMLDWIKSRKTVTSYHTNMNVPISVYFVHYINTKNYFFLILSDRRELQNMKYNWHNLELSVHPGT